MVTNYLRLLRVHQYLKNTFVFAPLFFSGNIMNIDKLKSSFICFSLFCLAASSIYIFNDFRDLENDKIHPEKKNRPLASGKINKNFALNLAMVLALMSLLFAYVFLVSVLWILVGYLILNILYTISLKKIPIIDVVIVSIGFVLRIFAGGNGSEINVSHWLVIVTFLLALFIAFAKRRDDLIIEKNTGIVVRKSAKTYNVEFINSVISVLCAVIIVTYILYVTSEEVVFRFEDKPVYISSIFVIIGLLRYLQLTIVENKSGSPTDLMFKDRFLQITISGWVLFFAIIIYYK